MFINIIIKDKKLIYYFVIIVYFYIAYCILVCNHRHSMRYEMSMYVLNYIMYAEANNNHWHIIYLKCVKDF